MYEYVYLPLEMKSSLVGGKKKVLDAETRHTDSMETSQAYILSLWKESKYKKIMNSF
jgi:hypothetical protein